jgi:TatD DNase family protein
MWSDAHLHLDAPPFDSDRDAVVARAREAGVTVLVSAGTTVDGSRRTIALAEHYPCVLAAVGIHPDAAETATPEALAALAGLARHPRVVAIGEVGLDYVRTPAGRDRQRDAFQAQLALAREAGLPVVVHDREAHDDVEAMLRDAGCRAVVLHCFSGGLAMAQRCAARGWMLSLAGPLTFPRSSTLRAVAAAVPLDRLLVETDAPYLAPVPVRGRRCEPAFVVHTAAALAHARGMAPAALAAALRENIGRVFVPRAGGSG